MGGFGGIVGGVSGAVLGGGLDGIGGLGREDRFTRWGLELGAVVDQSLAWSERVRGSGGSGRSREDGRIEVVPRVDEGRGESERSVTNFWIQMNREAEAWLTG